MSLNEPKKRKAGRSRRSANGREGFGGDPGEAACRSSRARPLKACLQSCERVLADLRTQSVGWLRLRIFACHPAYGLHKGVASDRVEITL
jgi:hypothetical protein